MNKFEDISVEKDYPWMVRFTENIIRDAPSQFNAYHMYLPMYQDKSVGMRNEEMARVHENFVPYHNDLVLDLLEEGEDRMIVWEKRTMKTSSSGKTTEEAASNRGYSPKKDRKGTLVNTPVKGRVQETQTIIRDNPVITQESQKTIYQSDINLSIFNETSPFKLSDISTNMTDEERRLRQQLVAIMKAKRGAKALQPLVSGYAQMGK